MNNIDIDLLETFVDEQIARRISTVNHIYVFSSNVNLSRVLNIFNAKGGVFGKEPLFDEVGRPYANSEDLNKFQDFKLWAAESNQQDVFRVGAIGSPTGFVMVVDVNTKAALLRELFDKSYNGDGYVRLEIALPNVVEIIEELGWCYIPLSGEVSLAAILLSNSKNSELIKFAKVFPEGVKAVVNDDELILVPYALADAPITAPVVPKISKR